MSRDFTPRDHHIVDAMYGFSTRKTTLRETATGKEVVLYDPDSTVSKQYPNLSFLFGAGLEEIIGEYGEEAGPVLESIESRLKEIISSDSGKADDPLYLWYSGELDPHFYYHETNDELLREYIVSRIGQHERKKEEVLDA